MNVRVQTICPSPACEAEYPEQRVVTAAELKRFGNPSWGFRAMVCQVCGCIYTREAEDTFIIRN